MIQTIKRLCLATAILLCATLNIHAGKDHPIAVSQLPYTAQTLLKTHFAKTKVALVKMEKDLFDKSYDIILTNATKIEVDKDGRWTSIECRHSSVPDELVPAQIRQWVGKHYPKTGIQEIERLRNGYEIKLDGGTEVTFNKKFQVVDIDR